MGFVLPAMFLCTKPPRGIPVVYCDDFGHGANHAVLPIGRRAVLDANDLTLCYESNDDKGVLV